MYMHMNINITAQKSTNTLQKLIYKEKRINKSKIRKKQINMPAQKIKQNQNTLKTENKWN